MHIHSLRFRLIGWYSLLVLVTSVAFGGYAYYDVRHFVCTAMMNLLNNQAGEIGAMLPSRADAPGEAVLGREIHDRFTPEHDDRFIRIFRPDGTLLYRSGPPVGRTFDPALVAVSESAPNQPYTVIPIPNHPFLLLIDRLYSVDGRPYRIQMGAPMIFQKQALDALLRAMFFGLPLLVVLAAGGGYLLIGRALHPVRRITESAREISRRNLTARLPVSSTRDELEDLSRTLNEMIGRLQDAVAHAARFSADASHELRTPLTILRGELDSLIERTTRDAGEREKLGSILEEIERLTKIVEGLFAISHLDAGEARIETRRFDLAGVVEGTADLVSPLAEDRGIALVVKCPAPVEVDADLFRIKQVIVNLLDNAIKYTPRHGTVTVACRATKDEALLEIADTGNGIPDDAMPYIFDRFYRAGKVRQGAVGGAGLGLSIVRSICAAHGGTITAENRPAPEGGALFRVALPLAKAHSVPDAGMK